jgi:N-acetylglucosamine-6-phosphate deacetylase
MTDRHARTLLLRNGRVVLPDGISEPANILIENGRLARIFHAADQSIASDSCIELDGLTLFPGFIDIHIHGAVGVDMMDANTNDLCRVGDFLARNGVTAWMPTLVPSPREQYARAISAIGNCIELNSTRGAETLEYRLQSDVLDSRKSPTKGATLKTCAPRVLGVHYEGPFVNLEQCGALHREHFLKFTTGVELDALPTIKHEDAVHLMTLAPEIEGGIELIRQLKKRNWIASIGHTRAGADVLDQALNAGARHMTHFMNAMTPLHHRTIGAVGWGLVHDDVTCDLIADGIHIDRSILKLIGRHKTAENVSLISDAIAAAGQGDGEYDIWGEKITVRDGRTANARGSIAGSVIMMLDAVRMMLSLGFSESEVARMASLNPARLLGIESNCGSIDAGKQADLVALDANLTVRLTIIGGRVAYSKE